MKRRAPSPVSDEDDNSTSHYKRSPAPRPAPTCHSYYLSTSRQIRQNIDVVPDSMIPVTLPLNTAQAMDIIYLPFDEDQNVYYTKRLFELYWKVYTLRRNLYNEDGTLIVDETISNVLDRPINSLIQFDDFLLFFDDNADYTPFFLTNEIVDALCDEYEYLNDELALLEEERLEEEMAEMAL